MPNIEINLKFLKKSDFLRWNPAENIIGGKTISKKNSESN